jgi:hypothetical protein
MEDSSRAPLILGESKAKKQALKSETKKMFLRERFQFLNWSTVRELKISAVFGRCSSLAHAV